MLEALGSCDYSNNKIRPPALQAKMSIRGEALFLWISRYNGNNPVYSE